VYQPLGGQNSQIEHNLMFSWKGSETDMEISGNVLRYGKTGGGGTSRREQTTGAER